MAVMAVGSMGAVSQAYADLDVIPLQIETDASTYDHESTIVVSGAVGHMRVGTPVTVVVSGNRSSNNRTNYTFCGWKFRNTR